MMLRQRGGSKKKCRKTGENRFLMDNGLAEFDLMVGLKMKEFVRTRLLPNNKFLADRWHIYSDTRGTLSFMRLQYLADVMGSKEDEFQYWKNKLVSTLNLNLSGQNQRVNRGLKMYF